MSDLQPTRPKGQQLLAKEDVEILKGVNLMGLNISMEELQTLLSGYAVSLENRSLSEIGALFIFAETLSSLHSFKASTFQDLLKVCRELSSHPGLPIHCWTSELAGKCCLLLAIVNGRLVVKAEFERCGVTQLRTIPI